MGRNTQRGPEALTHPEAADESTVRRPAEGTELKQNVLPNDDADHPICIPRRRGEELRLSVAEYRGRDYADLRSYYVNDDDEWRPGRGITVPPALWGEFLAGVVELDRRLRAEGLVGNEEGVDEAA